MQRTSDELRPAGEPQDAAAGRPDGHREQVFSQETPPAPTRAERPSAGSPERSGRHGRDVYGLPLYAALDLGTNNCRLLVARPTRRGFQVVDAFSRIIRLGEGMLGSGRLSEPAMDRTVEALKVCADKIERRGVTRSRMIATEACRIAENGPDFVARIKRDTGLVLEIVDRETEAKLAVSGCASLIDADCEGALVFDIGGGSSELIWLEFPAGGRPARRVLPGPTDTQDSIAAWTSLPVGVVTLSEQFGGRLVSQATYEAMVGHVASMLAGFEQQHAIAAKFGRRGTHLLGTSGTVTTVAGVHLNLPHYDRSRVDGCWLDTGDVRRVSHRLRDLSYEERVRQPCIGADRADLVLAGCAILEAILRLWPCERLRVADRGLREGILATLMAEDNMHRGRRRRPDRSQWT